MAAAFELSATAALRERFAVTVYQAGWRLDGKGASERDAGPGRRIEEHGLHVWFGFYEHAFSLMRRCYGALGEQAPHRPWTRAFVPVETLALVDRHEDGWTTWPLQLPADPPATEPLAPMRPGTYDLAFAYRDGDRGRPDVAAGVFVENLARIIFKHRGTFMARLRGGTGDVVFAPLYDLLRDRRGVEIRLFHWITALGPADDGRTVERIELVRQAGSAADAYDALDTLRDGLRVWPSRPLWERLPPGARLPATTSSAP
jgi:uncharacterized protein with NAD-binding domain and iron-sulfur cluster